MNENSDNKPGNSWDMGVPFLLRDRNFKLDFILLSQGEETLLHSLLILCLVQN
jgi:hypothetical protein